MCENEIFMIFVFVEWLHGSSWRSVFELCFDNWISFSSAVNVTNGTFQSW